MGPIPHMLISQQPTQTVEISSYSFQPLNTAKDGTPYAFVAYKAGTIIGVHYKATDLTGVQELPGGSIKVLLSSNGTVILYKNVYQT